MRTPTDDKTQPARRAHTIQAARGCKLESLSEGVGVLTIQQETNARHHPPRRDAATGKLSMRRMLPRGWVHAVVRWRAPLAQPPPPAPYPETPDLRLAAGGETIMEGEAA
jgi:hypothetical protein